MDRTDLLCLLPLVVLFLCFGAVGCPAPPADPPANDSPVELLEVGPVHAQQCTVEVRWSAEPETAETHFLEEGREWGWIDPVTGEEVRSEWLGALDSSIELRVVAPYSARGPSLEADEPSTDGRAEDPTPLPEDPTPPGVEPHPSEP